MVLLCLCFASALCPEDWCGVGVCCGRRLPAVGLPPPAWPASLLICTSGGGLGLLLLLTYRGLVGPFISLPMCLERVALMYSAAFAVAFLLLKLFFRQLAVTVLSEISLWAGGQAALCSPRFWLRWLWGKWPSRTSPPPALHSSQL